MSARRYDCDLVLKGGVTSGVVYPSAIVELSKDHNFKSIGGASAGAIAAVCTAAAQYGRATSNPNAFDTIAQIPDRVAAHDSNGATLLQRMFVPQPTIAPLFDSLWAIRKTSSTAMRLRIVLTQALSHGHTGFFAKLLALAVVAFTVLLFALDPGAPSIILVALVLMLAVFGLLVLKATRGAASIAKRLPQQLEGNHFGFCNGRTVGEQIGVTDWLHETIQEIAGRSVDEAPLTYADLAEHDINLVTMTTNLSQGTSEQFPLAGNTWAFDPADMHELFPPSVASAIVSAGEDLLAATADETRLALDAKNLFPWPGDDLPVLVGARISMSLPLVLSALPLWRFVPEREQDGSWSMGYAKVWMSDGGLLSNMPVHLFDSPLPSRPTYGINLAGGGDADAENERDNLFRPLHAGAGGRAEVVNVDSTAKLLGAVFNTMQNWTDNSRIRSLGYRDRICTIKLDRGEGGLNLDMSADTIAGLVPRGQAAGENLGWMVRGVTPPGVQVEPKNEEAMQRQWLRHRWTRYRVFLRDLDQQLSNAEERYLRRPVPQGVDDSSTWPELSDRAAEGAWLPYSSGWGSRDAETAAALFEDLFGLEWGGINGRDTPTG